jgi:hypothetical protein
MKEWKLRRAVIDIPGTAFGASQSCMSFSAIIFHRHATHPTGITMTSSFVMSNKRKRRDETVSEETECKASQPTFPTDEVLRDCALKLADQRNPGKTLWPSEIPRKIAKDNSHSFAGHWKSWMDPTHKVVKQLVMEGYLVILQKGVVIRTDQWSELRGPYRIRKYIHSNTK